MLSGVLSSKLVKIYGKGRVLLSGDVAAGAIEQRRRRVPLQDIVAWVYRSHGCPPVLKYINLAISLSFRLCFSSDGMNV